MSQRRATKLRWLAAACGAAGLILAIVLMVLAGSRPRQHIETMARAPVGCTTTLEFTRSGTYYVWQESSTQEHSLPSGDCEPVATGDAFEVEIVEGGGSAAVEETAPVNAPMYSEDGYSAIRAVSTIVVSDATEVDIAVRGPDSNVNAAIGRDPRSGVASLQVAAAFAFLAGLGAMILLLVLARRAVRPAPVAATGQWPTGYMPAGQPLPQPYHPYQQPYQQGYQQPYPQSPPQGGYPQGPFVAGPPQSSPPASAPYGANPYQVPGPPGTFESGVYQEPQPPQHPPIAPAPGQLPPPPVQQNWNAPQHPDSPPSSSNDERG